MVPLGSTAMPNRIGTLIAVEKISRLLLFVTTEALHFRIRLNNQTISRNDTKAHLEHCRFRALPPGFVDNRDGHQAQI